MRSLRYLILALAFIIVIAFAVANRHLVHFVFDPLGGPDSPEFFAAPLFVFFFAALIAGFVLGAFVAWLSQGRWRRAARHRAHELFELKKENERLARHLRILERAPQVRVFSNQSHNQDRPLIH